MAVLKWSHRTSGLLITNMKAQFTQCDLFRQNFIVVSNEFYTYRSKQSKVDSWDLRFAWFVWNRFSPIFVIATRPRWEWNRADKFKWGTNQVQKSHSVNRPRSTLDIWMLEVNFDESVCVLVSHVSYTYVKLLKS